MKLINAMICLTVICSGAGVAAQKSETETKEKIEVKDGKMITVTGCVAPADGGPGFVLTHAADKTGTLYNYRLVSADAELSKHVGHRVQVKGQATDLGDAKVKFETKSKTRVEHGDDRETHSRTEVEGDVPGTPYLGVKSVKMIAAVCP